MCVLFVGALIYAMFMVVAIRLGHGVFDVITMGAWMYQFVIGIAVSYSVSLSVGGMLGQCMTVTVMDGTVSLMRMTYEEYPLEKCRWRMGVTKELFRDYAAFPLVFIRRRRVPILVIPTLLGASADGDDVTVPLGYTDETREMWVEFFQTIGLPLEDM